jgi:hypothetical protein
VTGSLRMGRARRAVRLLAGIAVAVPLGAAVPAVALATVPAAPGAAARTAAPAAVSADSPVTFSFTCTQQTYTIPAHVNALIITAVGAPGGNGGDGAGGYGASVTATVPVTALPAHTTKLYVEVGGTGPCKSSGSNNGGATGSTADGGGASDVRTTSIAKVPDTALTSANDSRLVVAGGGGGGGGEPAGPCSGGLAGDVSASGAGAGGSTGTPCSGGNGGFGSGGGAAGAGGTTNGTAGSLGEGGAGAGGGGGGGYIGGGGGGYAFCIIIGGGCGHYAGGGGGSSFWIPAAMDTSMSEDTTGVPEVTITPIQNWAGYAVTGKDGAFKSVSAAWTQPAMTCIAGAGNIDSAVWVGLDGYHSASVERIGTTADCASPGATESPAYSTWWQMPSAPGGIRDIVDPGDQMRASVTFSGTKTYTLVLRDATQGWSETVKRTEPGLHRSSAEVITEVGGLAPEPEFGTVNFLASSVNGRSLGTLHPAQIRMINDGKEQVTASPISSGGAFSSTFIPSGGECAGKLVCGVLTWEPAQYGTSQASSTDACLAAFLPAATLSYTWQADGTAIPGATSSTYAIPSSLVGETLTCTVTAVSNSGSVSRTSSGAIVTAAGSHSAAAAARPAAARAAVTAAPATGQAPQAPRAGLGTWMPVLYGTVQVGRTVSCQAAFHGEDSVTYAWRTNDGAIKGATGSSYKIPPSLGGKELDCSVTAADLEGSASATNRLVTVTLGQALVPVTRPKLSGPHRPGKKEKVTAGRWSPKASMVTYQWYLGSTEVTGATKSSFTVPRSAIKGTKIRCVVTASAAGYAPGSYTVRSVKIT